MLSPLHARPFLLLATVSFPWACGVTVSEGVQAPRRILEDFSSGARTVELRIEPETSGAKGSLTIEPTGSARIDFDLMKTPWGTKTALVLEEPDIKATDVGISVTARGATGDSVLVVLVDKTGQKHERVYSIPGREPTRLDWIFSPEHKPGYGQEKSEGGAGDGVVHLPLKEIQVSPKAWISSAVGSLWIDSIEAIEAKPEIETVAVHLNQRSGSTERTGNGFLHSISTDQPADELIVPLKPKIFRLRDDPFPFDKENKTGLAVVPRLQGMGAKVHMVLSDHYLMNYGATHGWPGDNGNWAVWEQTVRDVVAKIRKAGVEVEWDLWNEPDWVDFWGRSTEQFYECWLRGYRVLREVDPDGVIIGPSAANFDRNWIERFLIFARDNNALPDVLCWHEMSFARGSFRNIAEHVRSIREFMKKENIPIDRIVVNEYMGPHWMKRPGVRVWFFSRFEEAGVAEAAHAIWDNEVQHGETRQTLCGILTYPERKPRSTWWVHRAYADMEGERVKVTHGATVAALAVVDEKEKVVRVLLGREAELGTPVELVFDDVSSVPFLAEAETLAATVQTIPDRGDEAVEELPAAKTITAKVVDGRVRLELGMMKPSEAMTVQLRVPSKETALVD